MTTVSVHFWTTLYFIKEQGPSTYYTLYISYAQYTNQVYNKKINKDKNYMPRKNSKGQKGHKKGQPKNPTVASEVVNPIMEQKKQRDGEVLIDPNVDIPGISEETYHNEHPSQKEEEKRSERISEVEIKGQENVEREHESYSRNLSNQNRALNHNIIEDNSGFEAEAFIIKNTIGKCQDFDEAQDLDDQSCFLYSSQKSFQTYQDALKELQNSDMIAECNSRIIRQSESNNRKALKVLLKIQRNVEREFALNGRCVLLKAVAKRDFYSLEEKLITGRRFCIITKSLPFNTENLRKNDFSTYLCFLRKDNQLGIVASSLEEMNLPRISKKQWESQTPETPEEENGTLKRNEYYLIDLGQIASIIREYSAVINCKDNPLMKSVYTNNLRYQQKNGQANIDKTEFLISEGKLNRKKLDKYQANAVQKIGRRKNGISLINGLPGTGKTEVVVEIAQNEVLQSRRQLAMSQDGQKDKVMICSISNAAIDNIYEKLLSHAKDWNKNPPNILRVSCAQQLNTIHLSSNFLDRCEIKAYEKQWQLLEKNIRDLMEECDIIICTLNTSGMQMKAKFYKHRVRCLLIDDANFATQISTLIPFATLVEKVVLLGNKDQFVPTVKTKLKSYKESLFYRLCNKKKYFDLQIQYRMSKEIMEFRTNNLLNGFGQRQAQVQSQYEDNYSLQAQRLMLHYTTGTNDYDEDHNLNNQTIKVYDYYTQRELHQKAFQSMQRSNMIAQVKQSINYLPINHKGIKVWLREQQDDYQLDKKIVMLKAVEKSDECTLKEMLISGSRFGIITKAQEFSPQNLKNNAFSTFTCFLTSTNKVYCLQNMNIPPMTRQQWNTAVPQEDGAPLRPNEYYFIDLGSKVSNIRQYSAVANCEDSPLIEQITTNRIKYELYQRAPTINKDDFLTQSANQSRKRLDQTQEYIVKMIGRRKKGISLIQGLPGTGKTEVLAEIAENEMFQIRKGQATLSQENPKDKIIICTATNAGADNCYERLLGLNSDWKEEKNPPKILRVCHTDEMDDKHLSSNYHHQREIRVLNTQDNPEEWTVTLRQKKKECEERIKRLKAKKERKRSDIRLEKKKIQAYEEKIVETNQRMSNERIKLEGIEKELMEESDIIICTLNVTGMKKMANFFRNRVRCLLIDDANQATETSTLIPFATLVEKVVLVGNKYQLRPTVKTGLQAYYRSLFERLSAQNRSFILETQYRMTKEIMKFPNQKFCREKLKCMRTSAVPESLSNFRHKFKFCDVTFGVEEACHRDFINRAQVECVMTMIKALTNRDENLTIGVIAAYKEQVKLIESEIFALDLKVYLRKNVHVGTIEAFQGLQMDVILFSTVHSNNKRQIGALYVKKRLNLAFTRAKSAFFVFGSAKTLRGNQTWKSFLDHHEERRSIQTIEQVEAKTFFAQL